MRVLILTNYFPPEIGGAARLFYELAKSLAQRGHRITVVTGFPRYNVKERLPQYRRKLWVRERLGNVDVIRLWIPSMPRRSLALRGIEHFLAPAILTLGGLLAGKQDVVIVYSPPLPLGLSAFIIGLVKHTPSIVNVQDLFPKEAVLLGLLRNKYLIRVFESIERFVYHHVDCIAVHSPGNRDHVVAQGASPEQVQVIYNWVDVERVTPGRKDNWFRRQHGLRDKFVVSYAGTMGWCQDMDVIVETADLLKDHEQIVFVLVGDGPMKQTTEEEAKRRGLHNVMFLPPHPWEQYVDILRASDVSMINLNSNLTTPVVPSKLLNIMSCGRPVVASLPLNSDAVSIIREAECGKCVPAGDAKALAEAILELYRNPSQTQQFGVNARSYAVAHFAREVCVNQYEQLFEQLCCAKKVSRGSVVDYCLPIDMAKAMNKNEEGGIFKLAIITQDDPFYIYEFFKHFLHKAESAQFSIPLIVVLPPFNEGIFSLVKRMYGFYGPIGFLRRGLQYVTLKLLDRLGWAQRSVWSIARQYGIPVREVANVNSPEFIHDLRALSPDVILSVATPQIFKQQLLNVPKWGCVNIHSAKLPKYRGMMPNFWAMYHGDPTAGITVHLMDAQIDRGKIILQGEIPIYPNESLDSLIRRSKRAAADLAIRALEQIRDDTVQLRDYEGEGAYFSFPKREHIRRLRARGHRLL
jgi:glycosyltransferase involved in cell wall biosynthesis/folate-dependent phosphoribosylglycinamide formyltransferase PurN